MLNEPNDFWWRMACGTHLTNIKLKKANADATLGLLALLAPLRRLLNRLKRET